MEFDFGASFCYLQKLPYITPFDATVFVIFNS
jgi:hypothetical protein